jgi:hypothetical protein
MLCPVIVSQRPRVLSADLEMILVPSDENATDQTKPEWPLSVLSWAPLTASHSRRVLSLDPDTICVPSGENATDRTELEWPQRVLR